MCIVQNLESYLIYRSLFSTTHLKELNVKTSEWIYMKPIWKLSIKYCLAKADAFFFFMWCFKSTIIHISFKRWTAYLNPYLYIFWTIGFCFGKRHMARDFLCQTFGFSLLWKTQLLSSFALEYHICAIMHNPCFVFFQPNFS